MKSVEEYMEQIDEKIHELEKLRNVKWTDDDEALLQEIEGGVAEFIEMKADLDGRRAKLAGLFESLREGKTDEFLRIIITNQDVLGMMGLKGKSRKTKTAVATSPDDADASVYEKCLDLVGEEAVSTAVSLNTTSNSEVAKAVLGSTYDELSPKQQHQVQNKVYTLLKGAGMK